MKWLSIMSKPIVMGHRANSLRSLVRYVLEDIEAIEVDVTYDISLKSNVVRHPRDEFLRLDSGEAGRSWISKLYSSLYLKGYIKLSDFLKVIDENLRGRIKYVMLDLKTGVDLRDLSKLIMNYVDKYEVFISSKYHPYLVDLDRGLKIYRLATLDERPYNPVSYLDSKYFEGVSINYSYIDNQLLEELHRLDMIVAVWTVNDMRSLSDLEDYPDILISDYPWKIRYHI